MESPNGPSSDKSARDAAEVAISGRPRNRHCEKRSDEAIQGRA
jgi:hypothetical protein